MDTTDIWQQQHHLHPAPDHRSSFYLDDNSPSSPSAPHEPLFNDDYLPSGLNSSSLPQHGAPSFTSWAEEITSRLSWNHNLEVDLNNDVDLYSDDEDDIYSDHEDDFYQTKLALQVCLFAVGKAKVVTISREGSIHERPMIHGRQASVSSHSSATSQQSSGGFSIPSDSSSVSGWTKTPCPTSPSSKPKPISPAESIYSQIDAPTRQRPLHKRNFSGSISKSYKAKLDKDVTPVDIVPDNKLSVALKRTSLVLPSVPLDSPKSPRGFRNRTWFRS